MSASIQSWTTTAGTYTFSDTGRPRYSRSATYEGGADHAMPRRKIVRHRITQWFREPGFADNQARYAELRAALAVPEGTLLIVDEGGTERVNTRARVLTENLPEQWGQSMMEVDVEFESVEAVTTTGSMDATFTPAGGSAITLGSVTKWSERIVTQRYSDLVPNRRESILTVAAEGEFRADPAATPDTRRTAMLGKAADLRGLDSKSGVLAYGSSFSQTMKIGEVAADAGDGTDRVRWMISAQRTMFPSGDFAEASYKVETDDDTEANSRITTLRGSIRAKDAASAEGKRDALQAVWASGRAFRGMKWDRARVSGADNSAAINSADSADLLEWEFAMSFREPLPGAVVSYTLKVSDRLDSATGLITTTYSGRVTAADTATALAKARDLGQDKYPMKVSEDEEVDVVSLAGSAEQHTQVAFAYAYHRRGSQQHAEVTVETSTAFFGRSGITVSGYAVAATAELADALADTFKLTGMVIEGERKGDAESYHESDQLFMRIAFQYSYLTAASAGTLEYVVRTEDDFDRRETVTTYTGTARAASASAAETLITSLTSGLTGRWVANVREAERVQGNSVTVFTGTRFTVAKAAALSNAETILDADVTVTVTPSVTKAVITEIPYGTPHVQSNVGQTAGSIVASGSVRATSYADALAWAQGWVPSGGYYATGRATEAYRRVYQPRSGTTILAHQITFSYPKDYATVAFLA